MKIVNILFNYKKSSNVNKILGVERCFIDYSKSLVNLGHEVLSITKPNMVFADEVKKTKSKFLEVRAANQADIFSIIKLTKSFLSFNPEVIICHSGRALLFARMVRSLTFKKYPIVAIDHGVNPKKFLKADYVLTVNSFFAKEVVRAGMPEDRSLVIPNMIDVEKDFKILKKKSFRSPLKLGSLGRVFVEKNFDKVLHAMSILKEKDINVEYVIGGVGPIEDEIKNLAKELGVEDNFKILGWVEDKRKFFDDIDIFILPSCSETFGIVLLEAMLYSTPIITSNSWGPDEIINHEVDGLKVSKDNEKLMPQLLADAIERLSNDEKFASNLAVNARDKLLKKYTSEVVIKKLESILQSAIDNGKR